MYSVLRTGQLKLSHLKKTLGTMLYWGQRGLVKDTVSAVKWVERSALQMKDPSAMYDYSILLMKVLWDSICSTYFMIRLNAGYVVCACVSVFWQLSIHWLMLIPAGPRSEKKLHSRFSSAEEGCSNGTYSNEPVCLHYVPSLYQCAFLALGLN